MRAVRDMRDVRASRAVRAVRAVRYVSAARAGAMFLVHVSYCKDVLYCTVLYCLTEPVCYKLAPTCVLGSHRNNLSLSESKTSKHKIAIVPWW